MRSASVLTFSVATYEGGIGGTGLELSAMNVLAASRLTGGALTDGLETTGLRIGILERGGVLAESADFTLFRGGVASVRA